MVGAKKKHPQETEDGQPYWQLTTEGQRLLKAIRLNVEQDVPIPEEFREEVQAYNQVLLEGTLDGSPTDEKTIMKKHLKILEYIALEPSR